MLFNYSVGCQLSREVFNGTKTKIILTLGITCNVLILGYYKYTNFLIDQVNYLAGTNIYIEQILLPLAISFFTFQQIAYLVDSYRKETREYNFLNYPMILCANNILII